MSDSKGGSDTVLEGNARDFKLGTIWEFAQRGFALPPVHNKLAHVRNAFASNVARLKVQLVFWIFAINFAREIERYEAFAELEQFGKIEPELGMTGRTEALVEGVKTLYDESFIRQHALLGGGNEAKAAAHLTQISLQSFARLNLISSAVPESVSVGVEAFLSSLLLGMWTAFETLAADLWEGALNVHPRTLSNLKTGEKTITLNTIQQHGFDLSSKMGTILRDKRTFDRLDGIREAYEEAFHTDGAKIVATLQDKCLDSLSTMRNVIVHRNGIADDIYLRRAKSLPVPKLALGERLQLTGELIVPPIEAAVVCGATLIGAVTEWLASHPN